MLTHDMGCKFVTQQPFYPPGLAACGIALAKLIIVDSRQASSNKAVRFRRGGKVRIRSLLILLMGFSSPAFCAEYSAAIGHKGYGRCHMDECSWFIIDRATPIGTGRDGTLFQIEQRVWGADYNPPPDNAADNYDEYAQPPKSVSKQEHKTRFVYCSKTRPTAFIFADGKWESDKLRPGDQGSIFGYNEAEYTWYFAACHDAILKNPYDDHNLPQRLGYRFRHSDGDEDAQGNIAPREMLK